MRLNLPLVVVCLGLLCRSSYAAFNPRDYTKQIIECNATRRASDGSGIEDAVKISMSYVDINPSAGRTMLMLHGWPGLWSTWAYQIDEFKDDYHLIIPDHRGFGKSTHPGNPRTSGSMTDMVGDLVCVLEHAQVEDVICMGHDWGSQLCYDAARMQPDVFTAVIGLVVPYLHSDGPFFPISKLVSVQPRLAYQVYFDTKTETAAAELDKDIRRSLRATLRTVASPPPDAYLRSMKSFLDAYNGIPEIPSIPFLTPDEEDYLVEQYSSQGFYNTLEFYTHENRYRNWEHANKQGNFTLPQPVLAVYPIGDPVANWTLTAQIVKSHKYIPHLTVETMEGAHWMYAEHPQRFNEIVRRWLSKIGNAEGFVRDEL